MRQNILMYNCILKLSVTFSILLLLLFPNCSPDVDSKGDNTMIETIAIFSAGPRTDTVNYLKFVYDAQKRITEINQLRFGLVPAVPMQYKFFYTGSNNYPSLATYHDSSIPFDSTFYFYDATGFRLKDSVRSYVDVGNTLVLNRNEVNLYSKGVNDTIHVTNIRREFADRYVLHTLTQKIVNRIVNGNLISSKTIPDFYYQYYPHSKEFTFDNKPNPFKNYAHIDFIRNSIQRFGTIPSANNLLTYSGHNNAGGFIESDNSSYMYRADGYPLRITHYRTFLTSSGTYIVDIKYFD